MSILVIYSSKLKKIFFLLLVYLFCLILFYLIEADRNIFYILVFASFFNDTVAYLSGRFIGGPTIIPYISPKKTWSGTLVSFFMTAFVLYYFNFNIFISMIIAVSFFFGDIFFSYFKRHLNLKDFSNSLGEHGGILDRIDSMFFVAIILQIYLVF